MGKKGDFHPLQAVRCLFFSDNTTSAESFRPQTEHSSSGDPNKNITSNSLSLSLQEFHQPLNSWFLSHRQKQPVVQVFFSALGRKTGRGIWIHWLWNQWVLKHKCSRIIGRTTWIFKVHPWQEDTRAWLKPRLISSERKTSNFYGNFTFFQIKLLPITWIIQDVHRFSSPCLTGRTLLKTHPAFLKDLLRAHRAPGIPPVPSFPLWMPSTPIPIPLFLLD